MHEHRGYPQRLERPRAFEKTRFWKARKRIFYERTELQVSALQWGFEGHGWVLHCSRSGGLSWISQLRSLKRSPFGRWHTTSLVLIPPPHGLVHWGQQGQTRMVRISTWFERFIVWCMGYSSTCIIMLFFLPLPSCRRSTADTGPTHRTVARWADCDPRSCWQDNRSHPGTRRPAAGNLLHMCSSTVDKENQRPHCQTSVKPARRNAHTCPCISIFVGTFFDTPSWMP